MVTPIPIVWEESEIYDGCRWYSLSLPGLSLAIHIGRWRNHDEREWNSWTAYILSEERVFFPACWPIEAVQRETLKLLANHLESLVSAIRST